MTICSERQITERVYDLLVPLPRHNHVTSPGQLPTDGIYVFFEHGEQALANGAIVDRIVRVGTHVKDGNFRARIREHYGQVKSLGGNKNSSVFRKHLGSALLRRVDPLDPRLPAWLKNMGPSYPDVEAEVSRALRETFTFVCFAVPTSTERLSIESGLIALLSQHALGAPSSSWLGYYAASDKIGHSGLWNSNEIDAAPLTAIQLARLEELVGSK